MRLVSKIKNFQVLARSELYSMHPGPGGVLQKVVHKGQIMLEFKHGHLTPYEVQCALRFWSRGDLRDYSDPYSYDAYGAHPDQRQVPYDNGLERGVTVAWRPQMNFSVYDTAWIENEEDRAEVEEFVSKWESGGDCFVVEPYQLPAPWPAYDSIAQGAHEKIPAMTRDLGINAAAVIAYEEANKNRDGVIKGLKLLLGEKMEDARIDTMLEVQVP